MMAWGNCGSSGQAPRSWLPLARELYRASIGVFLSQDVGNNDILKMGSYLFKNDDSSDTSKTEKEVHNSKERLSDKIDLNTLKADKAAKKKFWTYIPPKKLL